MFWDRYIQLCEKEMQKANPTAKIIGLSSAAVTKWKDGAVPNGSILIKVADYFNVSVDYLLERTDIPEVNKSSNTSLNSNDIMVSEMMNRFEGLSFSDKLEVMQLIDSKVSGNEQTQG